MEAARKATRDGLTGVGCAASPMQITLPSGWTQSSSIGRLTTGIALTSVACLASSISLHTPLSISTTSRGKSLRTYEEQVTHLESAPSIECSSASRELLCGRSAPPSVPVSSSSSSCAYTYSVNSGSPVVEAFCGSSFSTLHVGTRLETHHGVPERAVLGPVPAHHLALSRAGV